MTMRRLIQAARPSRASHAHESSPRLNTAEPHAVARENESPVAPDLLPAEIKFQPQVLRLGSEARTQFVWNLQRAIGNRAAQRAIQRARAATPDDDLAQRIQSASSGGSALDAATRDRLEPGLGADLSSVRIHTDAEADQLSTSVDAIAFTTGQEIFFREGAYNPGSQEGMRLLAHEATHTVQQATGPVAGTPTPEGVSISDPSDRFEQAAEQTAARVASESPATSQRSVDSAPSRPVQRLTAREDEDVEDMQPVQSTPASTAFRPIQRDTGWSDASKQSAETSQPKSDVTAPTGTSWNAGETQIGSIKRKLVEHLKGGYQSKPKERLDRRGSTLESAEGKAVVLIPDDFNPTKPTTVLLHLHGFGAGYRQLEHPVELEKKLQDLKKDETALKNDLDAASKAADKAKLQVKLRRKNAEIKKTEKEIEEKLDYAGVLQPGQVRDVELYQMEQQLDKLHKESGPQIIAVLPQGGSSSEFGDIADKPTEYLEEVFGKLGEKDRPTAYSVALSGHSGGGRTAMGIADKLEGMGIAEKTKEKKKEAGKKPPQADEKKEKAGEKPPQVDEIILFDAINGKNGISYERDHVLKWLNDHIKQDVEALKKIDTEAGVDKFFRARPRFRGYFSPDYEVWYKAVKKLTDGLSETKITVTKPGKKQAPHPLQDYIRQKLADQYRVFGPITASHEKLMGAKRTEEKGKPAPSKIGVLHEALSALPVQPMRAEVPTLPVQRHPDGEKEESIQRQEPAPGPTPTAAAQPSTAAGTQAAVQDPTADDDFVNQTIESFEDGELKKQIGDKIKNRRDFLVGMQQYLGTLDDVINHFKLIRQANVPGEVHLHEEAAKRLEMVAEKLGKEGMPGTTVALGLRDRYHPHTKHGRGLMAHPCGFAIDFRAEENPHITDPRLVKLLAMRTGGATRFELGKYGERRDLIKRMGEQSAKGGIDPDSPLGRESAAFQARLEEQYKRVSDASKAFQAELADTRGELLETYARLHKIEKDLSKIPKMRKNPKKYGKTKAEVDQEEQDLRRQRQELKEKSKPELPRLFKPWLDQIDNEVQSIEAQIKKVAPGSDLASLPSKKELDGRAREVQRAYQAAVRQRKQAERKIKELQREIEKEKKLNSDSEKQIEGWDATIANLRADAGGSGAKPITTKQKERLEKKIADLTSRKTNEQKRIATRTESMAKLNAEAEEAQRLASEHGKHESDATQTLESIKRQKDALPQLEELRTLRGLKESLSSDPNFVFEGKETVSDPGVAQLLAKGFFTPDPERNKGEKFDSDRHGFNLLFLKTMTAYGFDLGVSWSPGSVDPMHLELVEGVEMIRGR